MDKKDGAWTINITEYDEISHRLGFARSFTKLLSGLREGKSENDIEMFRPGDCFFEGLIGIAFEVDMRLWEIECILNGKKEVIEIKGNQIAAF